ncbi:hypothetical protein JL721_13100 [Aureococcus anophagefferens]|nr:hypothetical protein JL721_13100 [Aureococcus anophagefferens]
MAASLDFFGDAPEPPAPPTPAPKPRTKAAGAAADAGAPAPWSDDDVRAFRKRLRLRVESEDAVPRPWASWDDGNLDGRLRAALEACAWQEPTSVQAQACPALAAGRDALVTAPTGSGKTGAFVVPAAAFLLAEKNAEIPASRS